MATYDEVLLEFWGVFNLLSVLYGRRQSSGRFIAKEIRIFFAQKATFGHPKNALLDMKLKREIPEKNPLFYFIVSQHQ